MKLSIIIVSFNSEDFIEDCLKSLFKYLLKEGEVIVVDNNSSDGTVKKLEGFVPKIDLIKLAQNLGFAKANNLAAKKAQGQYLFFLNPDTQIIQPVFSQLIDFYERNSDAGIVAPKLIQADGKVQESVKNLPTIWGAIKEFIFMIPNSYTQYAPKSSEPVQVECVYGAALLIKKDFFDKLGGFDEKFFLYYEDVDLCKRVNQADKKIYYYPGVSIKHLVGASKSEFDRNKLNNESFRKYHGRFSTAILEWLFLIRRICRKLGIIIGLRRNE